jgi:hypothetical protein
MQVTADPAALQPIFTLGGDGIIIHGREVEKPVPPSAGSLSMAQQAHARWRIGSVS